MQHGGLGVCTGKIVLELCAPKLIKYTLQLLLFLDHGVEGQFSARQNEIPPFKSGMSTFTALMRDFPSLEAVPDADFGEFQEVRLQAVPSEPSQVPRLTPSNSFPAPSATLPLVFSARDFLLSARLRITARSVQYKTSYSKQFNLQTR